MAFIFYLIQIIPNKTLIYFLFFLNNLINLIKKEKNILKYLPSLNKLNLEKNKNKNAQD
jgi:hypothetical protein